jgi:hypothetical protein
MVIPRSDSTTYQRAAVRAFAKPVKVSIVNWQRREFAVTSSRGAGVYAVKLWRSSRGNEAACSCAAAAHGDFCRHLFSVISVYRGVVKAQQKAAGGQR